MRILVLTNFYPPHDIGGYEQLCQEATESLIQRGHTCHVLAGNWCRPGITVEDETYVSRLLPLDAPLNHYRPFSFFTKRRKEERQGLFAVRETIQIFRPEVIFIWGMWNFNRAFAAACEQSGVPTVYSIDDYWPANPNIHFDYWASPGSKLKRLLGRFALYQLKQEGKPVQLRFEHTLCVSLFIRNTLVASGKLPSSARVVYVGIDTKPFSASVQSNKTSEDNKVHLLYFGGLSHHKGVHTAIEAIHALNERGYADKVDLTILGGGNSDYISFLKSLVIQYNIGSQVEFIERVPKNKVVNWLKKYDVFLFTSIWQEPFGRTIVEAMMAGLIVIGSNVGGSREIFTKYSPDIVFEPEDFQALADRIVSVIEDPNLRVRLRQKGRQLVLEHFTLERMVNEIEAYLLETVK